MEYLSQTKRLTQEAFLMGLDVLSKNGFEVDLLQSEKINDVAIKINGNFLDFNSRKEAFEFIKPILQTIEQEEERALKRERIQRELMLEACENVAKRFNKVVYTFSLGERE